MVVDPQCGAGIPLGIQIDDELEAGLRHRCAMLTVVVVLPTPPSGSRPS